MNVGDENCVEALVLRDVVLMADLIWKQVADREDFWGSYLGSGRIAHNSSIEGGSYPQEGGRKDHSLFHPTPSND